LNFEIFSLKQVPCNQKELPETRIESKNRSYRGFIGGNCTFLRIFVRLRIFRTIFGEIQKV